VWCCWSEVWALELTALQPVDIDVKLEGEDERRQVEAKTDKSHKETCPVYYDGESVRGTAVVRVREGKAVKHDGIKIEFVGSIGAFVVCPCVFKRVRYRLSYVVFGCRAVLRPRKPLRVSVAGPRACCSRRAAVRSDVRFRV
jgi:hypothetical protein